MNRPIPITEDIFWIGVNDRETDLFESLWPLPRGIAYNSYFIAGERTVLVDTVKAPFSRELDEKIRLLLDGRPLDYLVINHIEPDHGGSIHLVRELFPEVTIVGNKRTLELLERYHGLREGTVAVGDGDTLDLGGRHLRFLITPMVHWPETMMTWDEQSGVLFSGDVFGGFGALEGGLFDDEHDAEARRDETLRYYANVIGTFSNMVQKALDRVSELPVGTIAAAHGPVWRKNPATVISWYRRWSRQETESGAVIAYGSMYQNTRRMAEAVALALAREGVEPVRIHDVARTHVSTILADAWRFQGIVLGSATYNTRLFPLMRHLVDLMEHKKLSPREFGIFGSCGWSGGAVKELRGFSESMGFNLIEPVVEVMGSPSEGTFELCADLGRKMAASLLHR